MTFPGFSKPMFFPGLSKHKTNNILTSQFSRICTNPVLYF